MKQVLVSALMGLTLCGSAYAGGDYHIDTDHHKSPWKVTLRGVMVDPDIGGSNITGIGGKVSRISDEFVPELDITYYYCDPHFSAELILATAEHSVKAEGTTLGTVDLGKATLLPPTLMFQYHAMPNHRFNPYVGAGINYTYFFDIDSGPTASLINYSSSFGPAFQVGADIALDDHWSINIDVKKVFIESSVSVTTDPTTVLRTTVEIDPFIYGVGIGYRF